VRVARTVIDVAVGRRRLLLGAAAAAAGAVVGGGATFAVSQVSRNRYAIPQADLFGSASPTASADPSPTGSPTPTASPTVEPGAGIAGPLNILLAGIDTRIGVPDWEPHADSVMIVHVPAGLQRAYLFSLPRDLVVDIPAFAPSGYRGGRTKLTHAMSYGSRRGRRKPSPTQGFQLLAQTVSRYTGIRRFDAGAVLTFYGYVRLIDALGGVDLYVDQRVASMHRRPDGSMRTLRGGGYVGPQMVYPVGIRHLTGWQALDYARQRYIPGGDYSRQRHQQQLMKATLRTVMEGGLASDPLRMDRVLDVLGDTLIFDGRGRSPIDYAYALRRLRADTLTLVGLPGSGVGGGGSYQGEALTAVGRGFITALRTGRADAYLRANPSLVVRR
jgi:polyisoprenyl-teichoic acid--peptidoglycan teichoic acid transferase